MNKNLERFVFAALVLAVIGGIYWWWRGSQETAPLPVAPVAQPAPAPAAEPPPIQHPIEQAPVATEAPPAPKPLPPLAESDAEALAALGGLFAQHRLPEFLIPKSLIRRIVATVDNLPREKASTNLWPVKPASGTFQVAKGEQGTLYIGADNAARYTAYVQWMESIESRRLAALYLRFYPLFQEAYRDLGFPQGYFNDRLIVVIDHLLATPEVPGLIRLEQPKVLYEYVDPVLKSRSAGQQIMLRIGADNALRVKNKLRELRKEITRQAPRTQ